MYDLCIFLTKASSAMKKVCFDKSATWSFSWQCQCCTGSLWWRISESSRSRRSTPPWDWYWRTSRSSSCPQGCSAAGGSTSSCGRARGRTATRGFDPSDTFFYIAQRLEQPNTFWESAMITWPRFERLLLIAWEGSLSNNKMRQDKIETICCKLRVYVYLSFGEPHALATTLLDALTPSEVNLHSFQLLEANLCQGWCKRSRWRGWCRTTRSNSL